MLRLAVGLFIGYALGSFTAIPLCFIAILPKLGPHNFITMFSNERVLFVAKDVFKVPYCIDNEVQINSLNINFG